MHLGGLHIPIYATSYTPQITKYLSTVQKITPGVEYQKIITQISNLQWQRVEKPETPQEYNLKGDTITIWPAGYQNPIRLEFDFDKLIKIYHVDPHTGFRLQNLENAVIGNYKLDAEDLELVFVADEIDTELNAAIFTTVSTTPLPDLPIITQEFDYTYPQLFWSRFDLLQKELERLTELGYSTYIQTRHVDELPPELVEVAGHDLPDEIPLDLPAGFVSSKDKIALFTDREIFGTVFLAKRKGAESNAAKLLGQFEGEISVGDYIVHEDYGIAIYAGLTQEVIDGELQEYLSLQYAEHDELLIPIAQVHKLTKYIGQEGIAPRLNRLGKAEWEAMKVRTRKAVTILAKDLLSHYAKRTIAKAVRINQTHELETPAYLEFVEKFPFTETNDQLKATNEIMADLQKDLPMNRLLVGDVGFGKTEVIMRAAFKMVEAGHQVAVLCPTTVLCAQHFGVFTDRFAGTDMKIAYLSRFNSASENEKIIDKVNAGEVDIVIGTHALLRSDLKFQSLGLLVVDEEQRFGVGQKEKIKKINYGVHHLAVSATPIPRTLGMALSTIQDISLITQAPKGRRPIKTTVEKLDWAKVERSVKLEIERGGQVYFVHNRVEDIESIAVKLRNLLPGVRIIVAHGQQKPDELDKQITDFYLHKADILLCTTIIENGIDMPNVNTIVIHQAERFGLAQLYQLRGRVGRSDKQAYCYLFHTGKVPGEGETAEEISQDIRGGKVKKLPIKDYVKRLEAMAQATELGAGFSIASRDLEIRGAGNLLGAEQHGHISQVGYALYMQMLAQEVEMLKNA